MKLKPIEWVLTQRHFTVCQWLISLTITSVLQTGKHVPWHRLHEKYIALAKILGNHAIQ